MDILFKDEDYVFSYRVSGIMIHEGKILLQKPENEDGYSFVGGHVAIGETTAEALVREYKEETGIDVVIERLFAVGEVFFSWGKRPCHQISLYYLVKPADPALIPQADIFKGTDEIESKKFKIDFCKIPLSKLESLTVYPKEILPVILNPTDNVFHFVSKQVEIMK